MRLACKETFSSGKKLIEAGRNASFLFLFEKKKTFYLTFSIKVKVKKGSALLFSVDVGFL